MRASVMYYILSDKSDLYLMGKVKQLSLKKMSSTGTKVMVKPLRDNAVGNNGRQLTGGALTCVVMPTVRRVANLPTHPRRKKGAYSPLYCTDLDSTP